jgi:hypothetical protein
MIQPQEITQGDFGYQIPFTLEDGNANPVNLTGATLTFKVQSAQDPSDTDLTLSGSMTIVSASAGTCYYSVASGDFPNPGTFLTMVVATWSSSEQLSWIGPQLIVKPSLPQSMN